MKNSIKVLFATLVMTASLQAKAQVEIDITEGKIMAAQMMQIQDVKNNVDALINTVSTRGSGLTGSGLGQLISAIDAVLQEAQTTDDTDKMNDLWSEAMELNKDLVLIKASLNVK